jgi:hypothetical protein
MDDARRRKILAAIELVRSQIKWKPGKASPHLAKRIRLGHLPENASLKEYEAIIAVVVNDPLAELYLFIYGEAIYPTMVKSVEERLWLVMIGLDGVLETAFPPEEPENYLASEAFISIGKTGDLEA